MDQDVRILRLRYNRALEPVKVMLINRKKSLSHQEWLHFVEHTRISIIGHPDQYLGDELIDGKTLAAIIARIFDEFLSDLNLRGLTTPENGHGSFTAQ